MGSKGEHGLSHIHHVLNQLRVERRVVGNNELRDAIIPNKNSGRRADGKYIYDSKKSKK